MAWAELQGGDKLLARMKKQSKKLKKGLYVGFFPKSKYPNGTYVASVAYWNEYGTERIPARPFFRNTMFTHKKVWAKIFKKGVRGGIERGFNILGKRVVSDIKQSILAWQSPSNAPSTIKRKGFNNPLIDTMTMEKSVDMEIKK